MKILLKFNYFRSSCLCTIAVSNHVRQCSSSIFRAFFVSKAEKDAFVTAETLRVRVHGDGAIIEGKIETCKVNLHDMQFAILASALKQRREASV